VPLAPTEGLVRGAARRLAGAGAVSVIVGRSGRARRPGRCRCR